MGTPTRREDSLEEANVTRREDSNATRREGTTPDANATRREGSATSVASGGTSPHGRPIGRVTRLLPGDLADRYLPLRDLPKGAQSGVLVAEERASGVVVVIKLYRHSGEIHDAATRAALTESPPEHVVRVLDWGMSEGTPWEVMEYCAFGTLEQPADATLRRPDPERFSAIARELTEALAVLEERGIVHRDLKPANVLIRTIDSADHPEELDLVLADFGLSRQLAMTHDVGSVAGTYPYMSPEALKNKHGHAGDWWALGVMLYELVAGRHFLAEPDGKINEATLQYRLRNDDYRIAPAGTDRQWLLLRGLLTYRDADRWRAQQVREWLAGGSPAVVGAGEVPPDGQSGPGTGPVRKSVGFAFAGDVVFSPAELAQTLRTRWDAAAKSFAGRKDEALLAWLERFDCGADARSVVESGTVPAATMVALQAVLDPETPPAFRGIAADEILPRLASYRGSAGNDDDDADSGLPGWARAVRQQRGLQGFAIAGVGIGGLDARRVGQAVESLQSWHEQIERALTLGHNRHREITLRSLLPLEPSLVAAALGDPAALQRTAEEALAAPGELGWAANLVESARGSGELGTLVAAMTARAAVAQEKVLEAERQRRVAQERAQAEREAAERRAREARERARAQAQEAEAAARAAWRRGLGVRIAKRVAWALLWAAIAGGVLLTGHAGVQPMEVVRAGLPVAIAGLAAVVVGTLVEAATLRRDLSSRDPVMTLAFVVGVLPVVRGMLDGTPTVGQAMALPLSLGAAWVVCNLVGLAVHRTVRERLPDQVRTPADEIAGRSRAYRRVRRLALVLASVAVTAGLVVLAFRLTNPVYAEQPVQFLFAGGADLVGVLDWFAGWPLVDPLGLRDSAAPLVRLALVAFVALALAADLRRIRPAAGWVALAVAGAAVLPLLLGLPWLALLVLVPSIVVLGVLAFVTD